MMMRQNDGWLYAPHICPPILRILPRQWNLKNSCDILKMKTSTRLYGATPIHAVVYGAALTVNSREEALVEFLNSSNLEILNQGNNPTFCSGSTLEVIDIILGFLGLLESITDWEVSSEPSLSYHRHILFILRGSVPVRLIRNPRGTNWGSFKGDLRDRLERGTK